MNWNKGCQGRQECFFVFCFFGNHTEVKSGNAKNTHGTSLNNQMKRICKEMYAWVIILKKWNILSFHLTKPTSTKVNLVFVPLQTPNVFLWHLTQKTSTQKTQNPQSQKKLKNHALVSLILPGLSCCCSCCGPYGPCMCVLISLMPVVPVCGFIILFIM